MTEQLVQRSGPSARCPLRPGQPCTLCHPEAHRGPQDCPTVALVMSDPNLRAELNAFRANRHLARPATTTAAQAIIRPSSTGMSAAAILGRPA